MINVKQTLLSTIKKHINNLRYLAINNPNIFKKIMYLIVLDEVYDWSSYLEDKLAILKKLLDLRIDYLLKHKEFVIEHFADTITSASGTVYPIPELLPYTNVNTPLTMTDWLRIWDSSNKEILTLITSLEQGAIPFTPDYTCPLEIIYYPTSMYGGIERSTQLGHIGEPVISNLNNLTTCEKMNIFVDRQTGVMYYLNPEDCTWQKVKSTGVLPAGTTIDWGDINNKPYFVNGVKHSLIVGSEGTAHNNTVEVTLTTEEDPTSSMSNYGIDLATEDEIGGLL